MLPEGFQWANRYQYDKQQTALVYRGKQVAMLLDRVGGGWVARLDVQKPSDHPLVFRECASLESGRAGIEAWACRHQERIRREVGG